LRKVLLDSVGRKSGLGLRDADVRHVVEALRSPEEPLLEKMNIYLLYRAWSDKQDLRSAASKIQADCSDFRRGIKGKYAEVYSHFSGDLLAQLFRDTGRSQEYIGLES